MNNSELTETVRRCPCVIPKERMSGRFYEPQKLELTWNGGIKTNRLEILFPDYFIDAPCSVITDLTKRVIQKGLYNSYYPLSEITKSWMMTELHTPENVSTYIERNGLTVIRQFEDVTVVSSDDDDVDWSIFFKVMSVPKNMLDSPKLDETIAETYETMVSVGESFLEA